MNQINRVMMACAIVATGMLGIVSNLSAGVIAYWDFSSDSKGVTDVSGNMHSLTNSGVTISNGAALFNGNPAVLHTARRLDLRSYTALTVEFFVKTPVTSGVMMAVEHSANTGLCNGGFFFDINDVDRPGALCNSFHCAGDWNIDATPAGATSDGLWHHVAMVYDTAKSGADRKMLYFDGVAQATFLSYVGETFWGFANETLYIGSRADNEIWFSGELDDLRILSTALAPEQFLQVRTEGAHAVVAHWRFDKDAELVDASGNGNALTASGILFTNGVARMDGSQVAFNTAGTLDLTTCTTLTVEFFMRTSSTNLIIALEQTATPFFNTPGAFIVDVNDGGDGPGRVIGGFCTYTGLNLDMTPVNAVDDSQWHHVALVYDSAQAGNGRSTLYFDGAIAQETFGPFNDGTPTPFLNATLYIGSRGNNSNHYIGELDDIRITGAALRPGQFLKSPSTELPRVIAYWPFPKKQPLADASGNGRTLSGSGVTFANDAAVFNGSQIAFSTLPRTLNLRPYSALTIECFVRSTASTAGILFEHTATFNTFRGGFLALVNGDVGAEGKLDSGFSMPGLDPYNIDSTVAGALSDGQWHHIALVYDPEQTGDDHVRVYLDQLQQGKWNSGWNSDAETAFFNDVFFIGSRNNNDSKFIGELDDLRITGAVLAPEEFMQSRTYFGGTIFLVQ